jgi:hypothetical protein
MNRFLYAATVGFLFTATATADPPVTTTPTVVGAPAPVVGSTVPTPTVVNTLTTPSRRMGLFARLRARNTNPMMTTSAAYGTGATTVPATTVPAPMPAVTTPPPGSTSNATPAITGAPVVAAGGTMTPTEMMTNTNTSRRMGLLARLRMRRE